MDFVQQLGLIALGSRLRRLSDQMMSSVVEVYKDRGSDFEPRWFPLYRLLAELGPKSVGEAAAAIGVSHAAISQTARAMTTAGLLRSKRDPADERRRVLDLTDSGRRMLPELREIWSDIENAVQEVMDYSGIDMLAALDGFEAGLTVENLFARSEVQRRERQLNAVEIVGFSPELAPHFESLNVEWLETYFAVEDLDREIFANPEHIIDDGGHIFFAIVDGQVVGTCALIRTGPDRCELAKMGVTEAFRGRQIGKRLLLHALEVAREDGFRSVYLVTNSQLLPAVGLYRKLGFRVTAAGPHPKYDRGDLTMEKWLEPDPAQTR